MVLINKIVGFFANPLAIGMTLVTIAFVLAAWRRGRATIWAAGISIAWFWVMSMPITSYWLGYWLEKDYPVRLVEELPEADAIVELGGGVGGCEQYPYVDLGDAADRAWHAVRLWKAKKAPIIVPSGIVPSCSDAVLFREAGIPEDALLVEDKARNTEENAKLVRKTLNREEHVDGWKPKVLLVTSASHMRRSLYMFEKYAPDIECIPAATDYLALPWKDEPFKWRNLLPNIGAFARNNTFFHEYIGYYGYKCFRK